MPRTVLHYLLYLLTFSSIVTLVAIGMPDGDDKLFIQQAMHMAYGNVDKNGTSTIESDGKTITFRSLRFAQISGENGDKSFLVANEILSEEDSVHASSPLLDFFAFKKANGRWKLSVSSKAFAEMGHSGQPPESVDFIKIGPESWALALGNGFSSHGGTEQYISLYRPDANGIYEIFSAITSLSQMDSCAFTLDKQGNEIPSRLVEIDDAEYCFFEETELFILPASGQLYDLKAVTTDLLGSEGPDGKPVPKVVKEEYFRFDAGQNKYIHVDKSQTSGPVAPLLGENSKVSQRGRFF